MAVSFFYFRMGDGGMESLSTMGQKKPVVSPNRYDGGISESEANWIYMTTAVLTEACLTSSAVTSRSSRSDR